jgi:hypothetical protein
MQKLARNASENLLEILMQRDERVSTSFGIQSTSGRLAEALRGHTRRSGVPRPATASRA